MHITYIFIKRCPTEKGKHYFMSLGQVLLPFHAYFRKILHNVTIPVFETGYWVAKEQFFGDPISSLEYRDGHVVQYFTKVRMEWQQNLPEGHKVVLSLLGRTAFDKYVGDVHKLME